MLENEINFELNKLENKLSNLLEKFDQLKNNIEKLNLEKEDTKVQLSIKNHELKMLKSNKIKSDEDENHDVSKKNKIKEEINKNIKEIDRCINALNHL